MRKAVAQVHDTPGLALDLNRLLVDLDQKLISVDLISRAGRQARAGAGAGRLLRQRPKLDKSQPADQRAADTGGGKAAFLFSSIRDCPMAKPATVKIKLVSTADTGFFYVTKKNPRTQTEKLSFKKYDPKVRKHVEFKETKIK